MADFCDFSITLSKPQNKTNPLQRAQENMKGSIGSPSHWWTDRSGRPNTITLKAHSDTCLLDGAALRRLQIPPDAAVDREKDCTDAVLGIQNPDLVKKWYVNVNLTAISRSTLQVNNTNPLVWRGEVRAKDPVVRWCERH